VVEMDAASHTGIDDIREIIEQVRYAPVSARYKVYIIDEVHMLSTQAFNGLLKTLEEPPPHVKFIFATTEIRKVPITVLSRCQRFDLRRVDAELLIAHLVKIARLEAVEVDDASLAMIARAAEGSVRDCLSIFDQAIAHGSGRVSADAVRQMLGLGDRGRVVDLFEHLMKGDAASALAEFRTQYDAGADPATILTDLAEFTHLVTRLRFVPDAVSDASLSEDERRRGAAFSQSLSLRVLSRTWQMLLKGIPEVQAASRSVSAGEMVLIRIAHAANLPTLDEALRSLDEGAGRPPAPAAAARASASAGGNGVSAVSETRVIERGGSGQTMRLVDANAAPALEPMRAEPQPAVETVPVTSLADIAALAEAERDLAFKVLLKRCVRLVRIEPGRLDVGLTGDAPKSLLGDLTVKLKAWTGRSWMVSLSREEGGPTLAEVEASKRETALLDARNDPAVAAILNRFPGARIIDVRIPDAPEVDAAEAPPAPDVAAEDDDLDTP
jgi:DNA polymerase-3 subunit gamma/tau